MLIAVFITEMVILHKYVYLLLLLLLKMKMVNMKFKAQMQGNTMYATIVVLTLLSQAVSL